MRMLKLAALSLAILLPAWATAGPMEDLVAKLKDKDSVIRRQAAMELGEMGKDAEKASPALLKEPREQEAPAVVAVERPEAPRAEPVMVGPDGVIFKRAR